MGKGEKRGVVSHMRVILLHMLNIRYQAGLRTASWDLTIASLRDSLADDLGTARA